MASVKNTPKAIVQQMKNRKALTQPEFLEDDQADVATQPMAEATPKAKKASPKKTPAKEILPVKKASPKPKKASEVKKGGPKRHRKILRDNEYGITNNALKRLALRAGITTVSVDSYAQMKEVIKEFLENVIGRAVLVMEHRRGKTIMYKDVNYGLKSSGYRELYGVPGELKTCPVSERKTIKSQIQDYQNNGHGCVFLSQLPFSRYVRQITQDFKLDVRFSDDAIGAIQIAMEDHLSEILIKAQLMMVHVKRNTLFPNDILLVSKIMKPLEYDPRVYEKDKMEKQEKAIKRSVNKQKKAQPVIEDNDEDDEEYQPDEDTTTSDGETTEIDETDVEEEEEE
jgi:histone H3/H4